MNKKDLTEYLDYWNQQDKAEGGFKPINPYQLGGYMISPSFFLKWYVDKEEFIALAKEMEFDLSEVESSKMSFQYGDQNVEIEIYPEHEH
ncbi:hypothetical protein [Desertivirga brevis]|uniref:hypothetical protein n=1 Tax=Desertivirga brevis TaxID=2810310 RepID=UPI001A958BC2|nr:hypothetical protein [Pedobacter sp. SYSU D00873]